MSRPAYERIRVVSREIGELYSAGVFSPNCFEHLDRWCRALNAIAAEVEKLLEVKQSLDRLYDGKIKENKKLQARVAELETVVYEASLTFDKDCTDCGCADVKATWFASARAALEGD